MNPQQQLAALVPVAIALPLLPSVGLPFLMIEAWFHVSTVGVAALLTGATLIHFEVLLNAVGSVEYRGGIDWIVLASAFAGALAGGSILFICSLERPVWLARSAAILLAVWVMVLWPLWGRGPATLAIALMIDAIILATYYFRHILAVALISRAIAFAIVLSGTRLALMNYLVDGEGLVFDLAAELSVAPLSVVLVYAGGALVVLAGLFRLHHAST